MKKISLLFTLLCGSLIIFDNSVDARPKNKRANTITSTARKASSKPRSGGNPNQQKTSGSGKRTTRSAVGSASARTTRSAVGSARTTRSAVGSASARTTRSASGSASAKTARAARTRLGTSTGVVGTKVASDALSTNSTESVTCQNYKNKNLSDCPFNKVIATTSGSNSCGLYRQSKTKYCIVNKDKNLVAEEVDEGSDATLREQLEMKTWIERLGASPVYLRCDDEYIYLNKTSGCVNADNYCPLDIQLLEYNDDGVWKIENPYTGDDCVKFNKSVKKEIIKKLEDERYIKLSCTEGWHPITDNSSNGPVKIRCAKCEDGTVWDGTRCSADGLEDAATTENGDTETKTETTEQPATVDNSGKTTIFDASGSKFTSSGSQTLKPGCYAVQLAGAGGGTHGNYFLNWGERGGHGNITNIGFCITSGTVTASYTIGNGGAGGLGKNAGKDGEDTTIVFDTSKAKVSVITNNQTYTANGGKGGASGVGIQKWARRSSSGSLTCAANTQCLANVAMNGGSQGNALSAGGNGGDGWVIFKNAKDANERIASPKDIVEAGLTEQPTLDPSTLDYDKTYATFSPSNLQKSLKYLELGKGYYKLVQTLDGSRNSQVEYIYAPKNGTKFEIGSISNNREYAEYIAFAVDGKLKKMNLTGRTDSMTLKQSTETSDTSFVYTDVGNEK